MHFRFFGYFFIMEIQFSFTLPAITISMLIPLLYWHLRCAISIFVIFDLVNYTRKFVATTNDHFSRREFHKLLFCIMNVGFWVLYWNLHWSLTSRIIVSLVSIVPLFLKDIWDFFFIQTQIQTGSLFPLGSVTMINAKRNGTCYQCFPFRGFRNLNLNGHLHLHYAGMLRHPSRIFRRCSNRFVIETVMVHRNGQDPMFISGACRDKNALRSTLSNLVSYEAGIKLDLINDLFTFFEESDDIYFNQALMVLLDHLDMGSAETTIGFLEPQLYDRERFQQSFEFRRATNTFNPFHNDFRSPARSLRIL